MRIIEKLLNQDFIIKFPLKETYKKENFIGLNEIKFTKNFSGSDIGISKKEFGILKKNSEMSAESSKKKEINTARIFSPFFEKFLPTFTEGPAKREKPKGFIPEGSVLRICEAASRKAGSIKPESSIKTSKSGKKGSMHEPYGNSFIDVEQNYAQWDSASQRILRIWKAGKRYKLCRFFRESPQKGVSQGEKQNPARGYPRLAGETENSWALLSKFGKTDSHSFTTLSDYPIKHGVSTNLKCTPSTTLGDAQRGLRDPRSGSPAERGPSAKLRGLWDNGEWRYGSFFNIINLWYNQLQLDPLRVTWNVKDTRNGTSIHFNGVTPTSSEPALQSPSAWQRDLRDYNSLNKKLSALLRRKVFNEYPLNELFIPQRGINQQSWEGNKFPKRFGPILLDYWIKSSPSFYPHHKGVLLQGTQGAGMEYKKNAITKGRSTLVEWFPSQLCWETPLSGGHRRSQSISKFRDKMSDETAVFNVLSDENYATDLCLGEFSKNTLKESSSDVTSLGYTKHILRFAESFSNAEGLVGSSPIKLGQKNLGRYAYDILRSSHIRNNKINESSLRQNEFIYWRDSFIYTYGVFGQYPTFIKAKKSVASFNIREKMITGLYISLKRNINEKSNFWNFYKMFVFVNYPTEKIGINERETNIQNSLNNKKNLNSQRKYKSLYNKNKKENLLIKIKEITLNDFGKLTYGEQLQDLWVSQESKHSGYSWERHLENVFLQNSALLNSVERSLSRNTNFLREIERDFKNICNIDFKVSFNETTLKAGQQSEEIRGNNRLKDTLRGSQRNTYLGRDSTKKPLSIAEGLSKSEDTQNGSNILSLHNGTTKISATRFPVPRSAGDPLRGSKRAKPHFVGYLGKARNKTNGNITKGGDLDYKLCEYSFGIKKIENISGFIFSNKLNQIPEYLIKGLNNPKGLYNWIHKTNMGVTHMFKNNGDELPYKRKVTEDQWSGLPWDLLFINVFSSNFCKDLFTTYLLNPFEIHLTGMSENLRSKNLNSTIESQENTLSGYLAPRNETLLSEVINNVYFPYNKKMVTGLENLSVQGKGDTPQRGDSLGEPLLGDTSQSLASQDTLFGLISQSTLIKGSHTIGHKYMEDPLRGSSPFIMQEENGQQDAMTDGLSASPRRGGVPQQSRGIPLKRDPRSRSPAERESSLPFSVETPLSAMLRDPAPRGKSSEPAMQRGLRDPLRGSPWDKNIQTLKKNVYFFSKSLLDSKYLINIWSNIIWNLEKKDSYTLKNLNSLIKLNKNSYFTLHTWTTKSCYFTTLLIQQNYPWNLSPWNTNSLPQLSWLRRSPPLRGVSQHSWEGSDSTKVERDTPEGETSRREQHPGDLKGEKTLSAWLRDPAPRGTESHNMEDFLRSVSHKSKDLWEDILKIYNNKFYEKISQLKKIQHKTSYVSDLNSFWNQLKMSISETSNLGDTGHKKTGGHLTFSFKKPSWKLIERNRHKSRSTTVEWLPSQQSWETPLRGGPSRSQPSGYSRCRQTGDPYKVGDEKQYNVYKTLDPRSGSPWDENTNGLNSKNIWSIPKKNNIQRMPQSGLLLSRAGSDPTEKICKGIVIHSKDKILWSISTLMLKNSLSNQKPSSTRTDFHYTPQYGVLQKMLNNAAPGDYSLSALLRDPASRGTGVSSADLDPRNGTSPPAMQGERGLWYHSFLQKNLKEENLKYAIRQVTHWAKQSLSPYNVGGHTHMVRAAEEKFLHIQKGKIINYSIVHIKHNMLYELCCLDFLANYYLIPRKSLQNLQ